MESWYEDFCDSSSHREIMLKDYSHTADVSGIGEEANYVTVGNLAACAVCHYGGYYYIRVMFD